MAASLRQADHSVFMNGLACLLSSVDLRTNKLASLPNPNAIEVTGSQPRVQVFVRGWLPRGTALRFERTRYGVSPFAAQRNGLT